MNLIIKIFFIYIALFPKLVYSQTTPSGYSLIAYEGFDYSNNTDIANQSGGLGWAGNWEARFYGNSTMIVGSSGLSYTGLNVSGNKLQWGGSGQYQPHSVRRAINNPNSGIVYLRFISDFNSSSGGTDRLDLNLGGATQASFGGNNSQQKMSILAGGLIINSTYSVYDLSLVVIQIDYTNNITKMWVKPTLSTFDYSNPGTPDAIYNNSIAFNEISLTFRSGGQIDEIAVFKSLPSYLNKNGKETSITSEALNSNGSIGSTQAINKFGEEFITKDVITQQGLIMHLDASDVNSYPGSGTTWTDLSGNGNDGTLQNEVSFTADFNGTMNFDGMDDYISTPVDADLQVMPSTTWTGWIKPAGGSGWHIVFGMEDGGWDRFLILENATTFALGHTGGRWSPGPNANYSSWQHVAVIYDSGTMRFYLNGSEYTTVINEGSHSSLGTFTIGSNQNGGGNRYKGKIAQVSVYDRVLSAAEINFNFNLNKNKYGL